MPMRHVRKECPAGVASDRSSANDSAARTSEKRTDSARPSGEGGGRTSILSANLPGSCSANSTLAMPGMANLQRGGQRVPPMRVGFDGVERCGPSGFGARGNPRTFARMSRSSRACTHRRAPDFPRHGGLLRGDPRRAPGKLHAEPSFNSTTGIAAFAPRQTSLRLRSSLCPRRPHGPRSWARAVAARVGRRDAVPGRRRLAVPAMKVATWNLTFYPDVPIAPRQQHFRTVMAALDPTSWCARKSTRWRRGTPSSTTSSVSSSPGSGAGNG